MRISDVSSIETEKISPERFDASAYVSTDCMRPDARGVVFGKSSVPTGKCTQYFKGDVLFSNIRTYFRKIWFADRDGACSNDVLVFRADPKVLSNQFLYYTLLRRDFTEYSVRTSIGAKMPRGDKAALQRFEIEVPCLHEQSEIAAALGALDNKIELNRRMAATLEAMARALYRSWFVDFDPVYAKAAGRAPAHMDAQTAALFPDRFDRDGLPVGWKWGALGDVAVNSRKHLKPDSVPPDTPYIGLEHMPKRSIVISDWDCAKKVSSTKTQMQIGQFLFGKLRPYFHKVGLAPADGICSTDILVIEAKSKTWREFVLSVISTDELVEQVNANSTGTRMPRAKWSDLSAFKVAIAPDNLVKEFSTISGPWYKRILTGVYGNQTLATLRDTLLPRLMSGELRVGEAREQVEEVV